MTTTLDDFRASLAAFAGELFDHDEAKGSEWQRQSAAYHLDHAEAHIRQARTLMLNAADPALIREEILHAQSRAIFSVEVFLRAQAPCERGPLAPTTEEAP